MTTPFVKWNLLLYRSKRHSKLTKNRRRGENIQVWGVIGGDENDHPRLICTSGHYNDNLRTVGDGPGEVGHAVSMWEDEETQL
jgi:hypothetical protein